QNVAAMTGAPVMQLALPGGESAFARIQKETSGFYTAAFAPDAADRNGASHQLTLTTTRKDVTVWIRPDIILDKAGASKPTAVSANAAVNSAKTFHDLPLRALAYGGKNPDPKETVKTVQLLAIAEPMETGTKLTGAE